MYLKATVGMKPETRGRKRSLLYQFAYRLAAQWWKLTKGFAGVTRDPDSGRRSGRFVLFVMAARDTLQVSELHGSVSTVQRAAKDFKEEMLDWEPNLERTGAKGGKTSRKGSRG